MDFDDVAFDGAAAIFVRWTPAKGDAALGLVFDFRGSRRTRDVWQTSRPKVTTDSNKS